MAASSTTSTAKVVTEACWCDNSMDFLVSRSFCSLRPRIMILVAPAWAKDEAVDEPMPEPPPVMRMVLLAAEREGRKGDMDV